MCRQPSSGFFFFFFLQVILQNKLNKEKHQTKRGAATFTQWKKGPWQRCLTSNNLQTQLHNRCSLKAQQGVPILPIYHPFT